MKKFFVYFLPWVGRRITSSMQKALGENWKSYVGVYSTSIPLGLLVSLAIGIFATAATLIGSIVYRHLNNIPDPSPQMTELVVFNLEVVFVVWCIHILVMIVLGQWKAFNDEQAGIVQQLSNKHDNH